MSGKFSVLLQKTLSNKVKRRLTEFAGALARRRLFWITTWMIRRFIRRYGVNMAEAARPDPASYRTFNEFFTRELKKGARPLAKADWICPVDGEISQYGKIDGNQIFQAKGHNYSIRALLGGNAELATQFEGGQYATIYLSPRDYHRIHMPCDGRAQRMIWVPGDLYSVNPATVAAIPGLFARNERVISVFETPHGPLALVLVGATIVGSMATAWHGVVNPPRRAKVREWRYDDKRIFLGQGAEMGRFQLGSTVIMLWPGKRVTFNPQWETGAHVRLGERMGQSASK